MASTDAKAIPVKNSAYRITFPILDADGDLVTGATGLDSEVSKDGGTFADCTSEATEIATSSGMYYLDLTSTEMNADTVALIIKTSSVGAKTTPIVLYPAARNINDLAFPTVSGNSIDVTSGGNVGIDWNNISSADSGQALTGTTVNIAGGSISVSRNVALDNFEFLMVASADHITPKTGATVTATRSIDGGAFAACTNGVTEVGFGIYKINLSTTDLGGGTVTLRFTDAACDDRFITIITQDTAPET